MGNSGKEQSERVTGVIDTPRGTDDLKIEPFVQGLEEFILGCGTPMTIAVQGDWGIGKTNMMMLVEQKLAPQGHYRLSDPPEPASSTATAAPVYTIRFNTWQYSQFEMNERLVGSLLENIGAHLLLANADGSNANTRGKRKEFMEALLPIASTAGLSILKSALTATGFGAFTNVFLEVEEAYKGSKTQQGSPSVEDAAAVLVNIKAKFAEAVEELVRYGKSDGKHGHGRLVVFIDDLDRLEPKRAIELMESLKLFLDVEHCVFVLAIDFAVVEQGVVAKYGPTMDRDKARSFFDKIIQVPFQMPIGSYQIDGLLETLLGATDLKLDSAERHVFNRLIQFSVGSNPRSIKRLLNTFMLLRSISEISSRSGGEVMVPNTQLFAILCMQTAYPDAYADLVSTEIENSQVYERFFLNEEEEEGSASRERVSADDELRRLLSSIDTAQLDYLSAEFLQRVRTIAAKEQRFGIEDGAHRFRSLATQIRLLFTQDDKFDVKSFERAVTQTITTSSGIGTSSDASTRAPKAYGAEARRKSMLDKGVWDTVKNSVRLPELFAEKLEALPSVEIGAQAGDPTGWVIEIDGKRVGMILVRKKFFHVTLESGRITEEKLSDFNQRVENALSHTEAMFARRDDGGCEVRRIKPDEGAFVEKLADLWLEILEEIRADREAHG